MINLTAECVGRPTLVLCLGGTGIKVYRHVMAMRATQPERFRNAIQPFCIDADQLPPDIETGRGYRCYYEDFGTFDNPIWEPYRQQRFPNNLGEKIMATTRDGAGAVRIFGQASLTVKHDTIANLFDQAHRLAPEPYEQIFIVAGGAGGTGSSMVIDVAAQMAHLHRLQHRVVPIDLILTGPDVHYEGHIEDTVRERMLANHYALLKELNHYCHYPFVSTYRSMDPLLQIHNQPGRERLFDWVYYFNEHRPQAEICWTIAEMLLHLAGSTVGRELASIRPNELEQRDFLYPLDFVHAHHQESCS